MAGHQCRTKKFTQEELNRILAARIKRERDRLLSEFECKMKRCMASIHLTLHQEMCAMKRDMAVEIQDFSDMANRPKEATEPVSFKESYNKTNHKGVNSNDT